MTRLMISLLECFRSANNRFDVRKLLIVGVIILGVSNLINAQDHVLRVHSKIKECECFPVPPEQHVEWLPKPSKQLAAYTSSARALYEQGFADPRGCKYCEIGVRTGSCWSGDAGITLTHGWVLPRGQNHKETYAVCWNGLVYPIISLGKECDYTEHVRQLIKLDTKQRLKFIEENPGKKFTRWRRRVVPESMAISSNSLLPLKIVVLLRMGNVDLAESIYASWSDKNIDPPPLPRGNDPYKWLAGDWVWGLFDRAVCAHMRGDDQLALSSVKQLVSILPLVEREVNRRKNEKKENHYFSAAKKQFLFTFQCKLLLADQLRRAKNKNIDQPKDGIDSLIADLENINSRQLGQPGGVSLVMDPRVKEIVKLGHAALRPLLNCLESDARLTRSVTFQRDFYEQRTIIPVKVAAFTAIEEILGKSFIYTSDKSTYLNIYNLNDQKKLVNRIKNYLDESSDEKTSTTSDE